MPDEIRDRLARMSNPALTQEAKDRTLSAIREGRGPRGATTRRPWSWFAGSAAVAGILLAALAFGSHSHPGRGPRPASRGPGQALIAAYPVVRALTPPNAFPAEMVTLPVVDVPMTHAVTSGPKPGLPSRVSLALSASRSKGLVAYAIWLGEGAQVAYFVGPAGLTPSNGGVGADGSWGVRLSGGGTTITLESDGGCVGCADESAAPYFAAARRAADAYGGHYTGPTLESAGVTANALDAYDRLLAYQSREGVTVASGVRYAPGLQGEAGPGGTFFQETIVTSHPSRVAIPLILDEGLVQAAGYPMHARTYAQAKAIIVGRLFPATRVPLLMPSALSYRPVRWVDTTYSASKESYFVSFGVGPDLPPNAPGLGFGNAELMLNVEGAGPGGHLDLKKWIPLPAGAPMKNAAEGTASLGSGITGTTFTGTWEGQRAEAVRFTEHGWTIWVGPIPASDGGAVPSALAQAKALRSLTFPTATGTIVLAWGQDAPSEAVFSLGPDRYAVEALGWSAATDVARMAPVSETAPAPVK